ncbi:MAG: hypothetical protein HN337_09815 [Deltaproteobacteria bacterium]|jgi:hypothetical protein|nr:hypothetical protein [Deltaproteobacteria bacterium]
MKFYHLRLCVLTIFFFALIVSSAQAQNSYIVDDADMEYVAAEFAPIFIAPLEKEKGGVCKYNIPTLVSFDANWDPLDNEKNYRDLLNKYPDLLKKPDRYLQRGISNVYYEAIASKSHMFITYYLFYPHDAGDGCAYESPTDPGGHQNDASSVMLIIRNENSERKLEWIAIQDHGESSHIPADNAFIIDGRPFIGVKNGTHQMNPILTYDEFPDEDENYFLGLTTTYQLAPLFPSLWAQRYNSELFCTFFRNTGMRFCEEQNKAENRGTPPWAPWAREFRVGGVAPLYFFGNRGIAQSFTDPIRAFTELYENAFYSEEYIYNPYN